MAGFVSNSATFVPTRAAHHIAASTVSTQKPVSKGLHGWVAAPLPGRTRAQSIDLLTNTPSTSRPMTQLAMAPLEHVPDYLNLVGSWASAGFLVSTVGAALCFPLCAPFARDGDTFRHRAEAIDGLATHLAAAVGAKEIWDAYPEEARAGALLLGLVGLALLGKKLAPAMLKKNIERMEYEKQHTFEGVRHPDGDWVDSCDPVWFDEENGVLRADCIHEVSVNGIDPHTLRPNVELYFTRSEIDASQCEGGVTNRDGILECDLN